MTFVVDYDGTITSNISFYQQLVHTAKRNNHSVVILSGCNPRRRVSVATDLERLNIKYDFLICRPISVSKGSHEIGEWKKRVLSGLSKAVWFDNEIKNYIDAGVNFDDIPVEFMRP